MKCYEGDQNEIIWRWSRNEKLSSWAKWNIMKVIQKKYYEGDKNEILSR